MNEISHLVGSDLTLSTTGDLAAASGLPRSQQRILRRLMTNPGDYIFHQDYGAGLPRFVGLPLNISEIRALIRSQMLLEESVRRLPEPQVSVVAIPDGIAVAISYVDAESSAPAALSFNVTN